MLNRFAVIGGVGGGSDSTTTGGRLNGRRILRTTLMGWMRRRKRDRRRRRTKGGGWIKVHDREETPGCRSIDQTVGRATRGFGLRGSGLCHHRRRVGSFSLLVSFLPFAALLMLELPTFPSLAVSPVPLLLAVPAILVVEQGHGLVQPVFLVTVWFVVRIGYGPRSLPLPLPLPPGSRSAVCSQYLQHRDRSTKHVRPVATAIVVARFR